MVPRSAQWYPEELWLAKDKMMPETFPLLSDHRVVCWGTGGPWLWFNLADVGREALGKVTVPRMSWCCVGPVCVFCPS